MLLLSRLSGLARDAAQSAAFGTSGAGDLAVLLFTLPDVMASLVASGVLAYVLVPRWAGMAPPERARSERRVRQVLGLAGIALAASLALLSAAWLSVLAPGLPLELQTAARLGLGAAGLAVPLALVAAVGATRLQFEADLSGLYGANLVVNAVLIVAISLIANYAVDTGRSGSFAVFLAFSVVLAGCGRLAWQFWRVRRLERAQLPARGALTAAGGEQIVAGEALRAADGMRVAAAPGAAARLTESLGANPASPHPATQPSAPTPAIWLWALLVAAVPVALPLLARSLASANGAGDLSAFHFAWKLVELPLGLAVQLVAALALPALARAVAANDGALERSATRRAWMLSWAAACACAAGLHVGAPGAAQALFGWGRANAADVARIAELAAMGAWALLPLALLGVASAALAARARLYRLGLIYALGLLGMLLCGTADLSARSLMLALVGVLWLIAALLILWEGAQLAAIPGRALLGPLAALMAVAGAGQWLAPVADWRLSLVAGAVAAALVAAAAALDPAMRRALRS